MDNYVRVYNNVMSFEKCQRLIKMFESDTEHHQIQDCGSGVTLTQINLLHSPDTIWKNESNDINTKENKKILKKKSYKDLNNFDEILANITNDNRTKNYPNINFSE